MKQPKRLQQEGTKDIKISNSHSNSKSDFHASVSNKSQEENIKLINVISFIKKNREKFVRVRKTLEDTVGFKYDLAGQVIYLSKNDFVKIPEAVTKRYSVKKVILETLQNSQEKNSARVSYLKYLQARPEIPLNCETRI